MVLPAGTSFGPYRILDRLGVGGMASVYHAFQPTPQREVALKVISAALAGQPAFRRRFQREANVLAHLEHPHILPIYEAGEIDAQPYICYRYIRGGTLKDLLTGPLPAADVVSLLAPVADALDFAHEQGIIHRDIKPANILLTAPDRLGRRTPIVADFGIARLLEPALLGPDGTQRLPDDSISLTALGVGLGTPAYMAPEQVLGRPLDGRTDQYALAVTAYQMLTGTVPYSATTPAELAYMHVSEPLPLPSSRNPAITPAIEQGLLKALAKDPADRYSSCGAFVAALSEALTSAAPEPAPAPPVEEEHADTVPVRRAVFVPRPDPPAPALPVAPDRAGRPARRLRRRLVVAAVAAVLLVGGAAIVVAALRRRADSGGSSAGNGPAPFNDGSLATARFRGPQGVAIDGAGTLYVTDQYDHRVRKIALNGQVSTFAGTSSPTASDGGFADGPGLVSAKLNRPYGVAVDARGMLYVVDTDNQRIRRIAPDGTVSTVAGTGTRGYADGPGTAAEFDGPEGIAVDAAGNLYVADVYNERIRKIAPDGFVTTLAGSGPAGNDAKGDYADGPGARARFNHPSGVALGPGGVLYVADKYNGRIRTVAPDGTVATLSGSGPTNGDRDPERDGPAGTAGFDGPEGIAVDAAGAVFVTDNFAITIRRVEPNGTATTLARNLNSLAQPRGIAVDGKGAVYFADGFNDQIMKVSADGTLSVYAGPGAK